MVVDALENVIQTFLFSLLLHFLLSIFFDKNRNAKRWWKVFHHSDNSWQNVVYSQLNQTHATFKGGQIFILS
jgi:hypothetical protein